MSEAAKRLAEKYQKEDPMIRNFGPSFYAEVFDWLLEQIRKDRHEIESQVRIGAMDHERVVDFRGWLLTIAEGGE